MSEATIIRKDGSLSTANPDGIGINIAAVDAIVAEHVNLRADGHHTGQVSSGAVAKGIENILALRLDPDDYSDKLKAMAGVAEHFGTWVARARKSGLLVVNSLTSAIELKESVEGKQIRGGLGEALAHQKVLLVANYHDEADPQEMNEWEKTQSQQGNLYRTESEENDFHAANIALAGGANILMLCTMADGFVYKGKKLDEIHVDDIPKYLEYLDKTKSDKSNGISKGGPKTKLKAAKLAITKASEQKRQMRVVIGHSRKDSRRILEDNAGTWVVQ